jgi:hypothetical protein
MVYELAVGAVYSEPFSASDSLFHRENTGKFRDFGIFPPPWIAATTGIHWVFLINSLCNRTGNSSN